MSSVSQGTSRQVGVDEENFQISMGGGGKLIRFNRQFLTKSPKFSKGDQRKKSTAKNRGEGVNFYLGPPLRYFYRKIFSGGLHPTCTLPLRNPVYNLY